MTSAQEVASFQQGSLIDVPTIKDIPMVHKFVVPQEDRNFHYPKEPFYMSTIPGDLNNADDGNDAIKKLQEFMKSNFGYNGLIDGKINQDLINSTLNFEKTLKSKNITIQIVKNNTIDLNAFAEGVKKLKDVKEDKKEGSSNIKAFQAYWGLQQTGVADSALEAKAKATEQEISKALGPGIFVKGMLWNDTKKDFNTTVEDLKQALNLISMAKNAKPEIK